MHNQSKGRLPPLVSAKMMDSMNVLDFMNNFINYAVLINVIKILFYSKIYLLS